VLQEVLNLGAPGYLQKTSIHTELLPAIETVLAGRQYVSSGLRDYKPSAGKDTHCLCRHEVQFYSDDEVLLASFTRFISTALRAGNSAIVVATRSHQESLLQRLKTECLDLDINSAIEQRAYLAVNAADMLSTITVNGSIDPVRFFESSNGLIEAASKATTAKQPRIALCGEGVGLLWAEGKADEAIYLEQLCNELVNMHGVRMLCAYPMGFHDNKETEFKRICGEHSAVVSQ
jgi:hypothetical protein